MANKQIEKLNDVLMEKEKQINYLLSGSSNRPTNDKVVGGRVEGMMVGGGGERN